MSNIISNYEISVWDDVLINGKYEEQRVMVIGSDQMLYQGKIIEPQLTRKANGEKKLTFKMYKQYIDNISGEKVENVFSKELVNERKVKLFYEDKWYDFYIKNIVENSSTYLYTYQLEDALVQELSKNGFNKTFDIELMNNLGTANELAKTALEDTDWSVEADVFTEHIEENLVYLYTPLEIVANRIYDNTDGDIVDIKQETIPANSKLLGFYSSCKNKPHRFQFIYLDSKYGDYDKNLISTNENRIITEANCQYYVDIPRQSDYTKVDGGYFLPLSLMIVKTTSGIIDDSVDTQVSYWFKGKRFGYTQKTSYVPLLETYANEFYKKDKYGQWEVELGRKIVYYGYLNTEYNSPVFTENVISNSEFKGRVGWIGSYLGGTPNAKTKYAATAEGVYGRFYKSQFQTAAKALEEGNFANAKFESYLKIVFPEDGLINLANLPLVINSGFYENRSKIGNITPGEEWCLDLEIYREDGYQWSQDMILKRLDITLREVNSKTSGGHQIKEQCGTLIESEGRLCIQIDPSLQPLTPKEFQNKQIKLVIKPTDNCPAATIYVKKIALYKKTKDATGEVIEPGVISTDGTVNSVYSFVKQKEIEGALDKENLYITNVKMKDMDYSVYVPIYNNNAEKTRTISIKESNYFNILQSISETFEAWLEIIAIRGDITQPGRITEKKVAFRKYLGAENYAAFRYGVNLKDIQRTYESKKLVTKLIVKQNSNELGKDGFCTIARAGSNPTDDTSLYDFRYFHNRGMLQSSDYVAQLYYDTNPYTGEQALGKDVKSSHQKTNSQNYFNRLKKLNEAIYDKGNKLSGALLEQTKLEADLAVQEGLQSAAEEGIVEVRDKFYALTGMYPDEINTNPFDEIRIQNQTNKWGDLKALNPSWDNEFVTADTPVITATPADGSTLASTGWEFKIDLQPTYPVDQNFPQAVFEKTEEHPEGDIEKELVPYGDATATAVLNAGKISSITLACTSKEWDGLAIRINGGFVKNQRYEMSYTLEVTEGELYTIGSHRDSFSQHSITIDEDFKEYSDTHTFSSPLGVGSKINVVLQGTYKDQNTVDDDTPYWFIQPNRNNTNAVKCLITKLKIKTKSGSVKPKIATYYIKPTFEKIRNGKVESSETVKIPLSISGNLTTGTGSHTLTLINTSGSTISNLLTEYTEYQQALTEAKKKLEGDSGLSKAVNTQKTTIASLQDEIKILQEQKAALNKAFYALYSRFIQEGTWISEEYVDDDKYYNDSLSVLYNSCLPQVAYSVNVIAVSRLPGYEFFKFGLGDKTHVIDPDFFGTEEGVEVVITEQVDNLDDLSKNTVKVQNFKNQFQDLFQKITATVQQTQYSTGSYEKAAALAEANVKIRGKFVTDALEGMAGKLAVAGQTTVVMDQNGITLTDSETKDEMRLIGGAILMSITDPDTGDRAWKTGLTPEGISASLVTAGTLNVGEITIMNVNDPVFRWDAFGLTAFDIDWNNGDISGVTNPYKFVRFDKYGIYGINQNAKDSVIDGRSWKPSSLEEIDGVATFALTWEGLKVTGSDGTVAKIGKHSFLPIGETDESKLKSRIMSITNKDNKETFSIDGSGNASFKGHIEATSGTIGPLDIEAMVDSANSPNANLLRNTKNKITNAEYNIATYPLTIVPKAGENYTISFKASPSTGVTQIGIYNSNGDNSLTTIYPSSGDNGYYKKTFTWKNKNDGTPGTSVVIFMMPSGSGESSIELVKLERGSIATDWVAATEDLIKNETTTIKNQVNTLDTKLKAKIDAIGTGAYRWEFSQTSGIKMWSGNDGNKEPVFWVGNPGGESGLKLRGWLDATGGTIADWDIGDGILKNNGENQKKVNSMISLTKTDESYTVNEHSSQNWRFYLGGTDEGIGKFGVDYDGTLYASGVCITSGADDEGYSLQLDNGRLGFLEKGFYMDSGLSITKNGLRIGDYTFGYYTDIDKGQIILQFISSTGGPRTQLKISPDGITSGNVKITQTGITLGDVKITETGITINKKPVVVQTT